MPEPSTVDRKFIEKHPLNNGLECARCEAPNFLSEQTEGYGCRNGYSAKVRIANIVITQIRTSLFWLSNR